MKNNRKMLLALSAALAAATFSVTANVSAEGAQAVFIRTEPIPEHISEYAEWAYDQVKNNKYMGFKAANDKLGAGFIAKDIGDGYDVVDDTYSYYYPIEDTKGALYGMLTIIYNSDTDEYSYIYRGSELARALNDIACSYDNPIEIYMSDQVGYAVTDNEVIILGASPPYSLTRMEELKEKLPEIRRENEKKPSDDVIAAFFPDFETGLVTIDGKSYYVEENGAFATGWKEVDGKRYYFKKTGEALTGGATVKGIYYTFDTDGACKGAYTGWTKSAGKYHYYKQGKMLKYCWLTRNGERTYFLDKKGNMAVGEVTIAGKTYTFASNGKLITA